jgi:8-oxo-dGTP pyrophosphatase MutT (NUDIX family)
MIKTFSQFIKESQELVDSTAVIALFNNGQLLALKRGMTAPWKPGHWNITGGVVGDNNLNESPKDAAIREVEEETGLTPTNIKEWGFVDTTGSKDACGLIYYFTGEVSEQPKSSDGENSEWQFIDKDNLDKIDWVPFLTDFNGCDLSKAKFQKSFLHEVWS